MERFRGVTEVLIEAALRRGSLTFAQLVEAVPLPHTELSQALAALALRGRVHNVGLEPQIWTWVVGDVSELELRSAIALLLSERPMSLDDLVDATGAPRARVVQVFRAMRLGPDGARIENMSPLEHMEVWFLLPAAE